MLRFIKHDYGNAIGVGFEVRNEDGNAVFRMAAKVLRGASIYNPGVVGAEGIAHNLKDVAGQIEEAIDEAARPIRKDEK